MENFLSTNVIQKTFLQNICKIILKSKNIFKSIIGPDNKFKRHSKALMVYLQNIFHKYHSFEQRM